MDNADGVETYTLTIDETTFKITTECTANIVLTTTNTTNALWYVLGYDTSADTASSMSLTANYAVQLNFPAYLLITINQINASHTATTSNTRANFCVSMSNNSSFVEVFNTNNTFENESHYSATSSINYLTVTLKKPDSTDADLNGGDWSMLLGLTYH